ncbi:MAG: hypothetical protein ACYT04_68125, partial [Nostoc sp.]
MLPPNEEWIVITYRTLNGEELELKQPWLVVQSEAFSGNTTSKKDVVEGFTIGVDIQSENIQRLRKILFGQASEIKLTNTDNQIEGEETGIGADIQANTIQQTRAALYAPDATIKEELGDESKQETASQGSSIVETLMPKALRVQIVDDINNLGRTFGYIRIFTFNVGKSEEDAE